jgi:uncharacterized linocin/CFP29 family protein
MNNMNLGRDKLPWKDETWNNIDQGVHDVVKAIRVAAKVLSLRPCPGEDSVPYGPINVQVQGPIQAPAGQQQPFIEISRGFSLTEGQLKNEEDKQAGTAAMLARLAATPIAQAEDLLIFRGNVVGQQGWPVGVMAPQANLAGQGLLGVARQNPDQLAAVQPRQPPVPGAVYWEQTYVAVQAGIGMLQGRGQPGPYGLVLASNIWADVHTPFPGTLVAVADRIEPLVPGGFYGTNALPPSTGLLLSLGGEPTIIAVSLDAATAFTQQDQQRLYQFLVVERIQFVAWDPRALLVLNFQPVAAAPAAPAAPAPAAAAVPAAQPQS